MLVFYFDLTDQPDCTSFHAVDLAAAKGEATKMAGRIISDDAGKFWDTADWALTVTDIDAPTQFQLQFIGPQATAVSRTAVSPPHQGWRSSQRLLSPRSENFPWGRARHF